ncbi:kielin/chordin-like protein isoform X2 [Gigantopelta aegis]|nr:kielin/chordin-like protein isoform X2 [Gigantopelta aegis]
MCNTASSSSNCEDKLKNCALYGQSSCVGPYESWAKANCAKFCNKCSSAGTGSIVGHTDVCVYKGKIHSQGETWQDGCDKSCTCVNGKSGYYTCQSKCAVYKNLPPSCTLTAMPGQCCKKPNCPTGLGTNFCVYKGKNYKQHQTWNDGCNYKCTCEDAMKGFYKCRSRCVQWNLPDECHLQAPGPGLCCNTPSCPPGFHVTYPAGYTVE